MGLTFPQNFSKSNKMLTSRTTTTTTGNLTASTSSRPANPLSPSTPIDDEKDVIMMEEAAAKKAAEEEEWRKQAAATGCQAAQDARDWAAWAQQQEAEVMERRRLLSRAATARSQWGASPSEMLVSPQRLVVEIRKEKGKGRAKVQAQPVGGDPDDGDDGNDDNDNEEDRAPCEWCKNKKLPCQMQAGKRSSVICKPCHDAKVRCSYSGRPTVSKQREGGSSECIAVMESQMVQGLADLWALREAHSKSQQYLRQLLRRQEDDHARLIAMDTRMATMGMEESEEEEQKEDEGEKKATEVEKDGEEEEEEGVDEETAPTEVRSEKGKERAE
ncbi:hypothetical protein GG344DRAFT_83518 [Lentinula edodes]|nr:hypothetical protein GG344DRAFT_83518 [Lentinula edodes]